MRVFVCFFVVSFLWLSCGDSEEGAGNEKAAVFQAASVQLDVPVDKNRTRYRGEVWKTVSWKDARGSNTLILSARPKFQIAEDVYRKRVYGYHYLETPDTLERINYMTDAVDSCHCDCDVYLVDGTIHVGDLNGDKTGEAWFAYYLDNRCDVSPVQAKLQLWSDGKWMALSGLVPPPEDENWTAALPEPQIDPKATLQDPVLRAKAKELWNGLFKK